MRERVSEIEREGKRDFKAVTPSPKLKPRSFSVEYKRFYIELDLKSRGGTITIAEESRSKRFQIGIGLGCAVWLIDQLRKVRGMGDQKVCKVFRGNNYNFWLENYKNKFGAFLKLSLCGSHGLVKTIIIPKGQREEGWQLMEENLNIFMFGISKKGFEQSPVEMTKISTTGQLSFDKSDDLYSPMKRREVESVDSFQFSSQQQPEEFKDTWGCVVVCERQTVFQSWKIINRCLSSWLHREVDLFPYQNNRAFFACKNCEEAKRIASQRKIPLNGQPEILLLNGWMA